MVGIADAIRDTLRIVSDPLGRAGRSEVFGRTFASLRNRAESSRSANDDLLSPERIAICVKRPVKRIIRS